MKYTLSSILCCLSLVMILLNAGCSKEPIRHLSSDAGLISQGTTKEDVRTFMGTPEFKKTTGTGEIWIFVQEHKSLLKKIPVLNWAFGSASYDLVYITFTGDIVTNCQYRAASEKEYEDQALSQKPSAE